MTPEDWIALGLTPRGRFTFALVLSHVMDAAALRRLAKKHGTKPKGFRVEKANAKQLAEALAEDFVQNESLRVDVAAELVSRTTATASDVAPPVDGATSADIARLEVEVDRYRTKLAKLEQSAERATSSRDEAIEARRLAESVREALETRVTLLERELERERADREAMRSGAETEELETGLDRDTSKRLADLEERDRGQRFRIAEMTSRIRELENENQELIDLLPRGERERRKQHRRSYEEIAKPAAVLPRFEDEFFRNVDDLEPAEKRKVFASVARLVLYGPDYPGLHTKFLKGMGGLSSVRAADGLRVYFRREGDEVIVEACGQREQQDAYLRRRRSS